MDIPIFFLNNKPQTVEFLLAGPVEIGVPNHDDNLRVDRHQEYPVYDFEVGGFR